mmetsp:Transcript_15936/g.17607  ORF Transcript_15936/g.17607 Transcript_15936/m.17607 type:complete len:89 (-) Transcript_15936:34-300(-)
MHAIVGEGFKCPTHETECETPIKKTNRSSKQATSLFYVYSTGKGTELTTEEQQIIPQQQQHQQHQYDPHHHSFCPQLIQKRRARGKRS